MCVCVCVCVCVCFFQTQNIWIPSSTAGGRGRLFILGSPELVSNEHSWDICEEGQGSLYVWLYSEGCRHPLNKQVNERRNATEEKNSVSRDCFVPCKRERPWGLKLSGSPCSTSAPLLCCSKPETLNSTACHHSLYWCVISRLFLWKALLNKYRSRSEV